MRDIWGIKKTRKSMLRPYGSKPSYGMRYPKREPDRHDAAQFYQEFLQSKVGDKSWTDACTKYPDHNYPGPDTEKAVSYILKQMKRYYEKKYGKGTWYVGIEDRLHDDIYDGLT